MTTSENLDLLMAEHTAGRKEQQKQHAYCVKKLSALEEKMEAGGLQDLKTVSQKQKNAIFSSSEVEEVLCAQPRAAARTESMLSCTPHNSRLAFCRRCKLIAKIQKKRK